MIDILKKIILVTITLLLIPFFLTKFQPNLEQYFLPILILFIILLLFLIFIIYYQKIIKVPEKIKVVKYKTNKILKKFLKTKNPDYYNLYLIELSRRPKVQNNKLNEIWNKLKKQKDDFKIKDFKYFLEQIGGSKWQDY